MHPEQSGRVADAAPPGVQTAALLADAGIDGLQALLDGLEPGVDRVIVDAGDDALAVLQGLLDRPGLDTLHLLAHGAPGGIRLAGQLLDAAGAARLRPAARAGVRLCLWCCDTARGPSGARFIQTLADATAATVYASDGAVGHHSSGGNWRLSHVAHPSACRPDIQRPARRGQLAGVTP